MTHANKKTGFNLIKLLIVIMVAGVALAACGAGEPAQTIAPVEETLPPAPAEAQATVTSPVEPTSEAATPALAGEPVDTAAGPAPIAPASGESIKTYRLIPEQSEASYEVEEEFFNQDMPFFTAIGRTSEIEGEFQVKFEDNQVSLEAGQFVVDLRTLTSNDSRRDRRIRNSWLESNKFPLAEFRVTGLEDFPANAAEGQEVAFKVVGDMTIREVTHPLTFDTIARLEGDTFTGTATTQLFMRDFGFEPPEILGILKVTDGVTVTVKFTAKESDNVSS